VLFVLERSALWRPRGRRDRHRQARTASRHAAKSSRSPSASRPRALSTLHARSRRVRAAWSGDPRAKARMRELRANLLRCPLPTPERTATSSLRRRDDAHTTALATPPESDDPRRAGRTASRPPCSAVGAHGARGTPSTPVERARRIPARPLDLQPQLWWKLVPPSRMLRRAAGRSTWLPVRGRSRHTPRRLREELLHVAGWSVRGFARGTDRAILPDQTRTLQGARPESGERMRSSTSKASARRRRERKTRRDPEIPIRL